MFHRVKPDVQQANQKPETTSALEVETVDEVLEAAETTKEAPATMDAPVEMDAPAEMKTETETETEVDTLEETPNQMKEDDMSEDTTMADTVTMEQEAQTTMASTSPYQRTPAPTYTTSYSPAASSYQAPMAEPMADAGDRRLTIGAGITMSGEIESCDYLLVEGTVEAALKGANTLEISESGTFYGTVEIGEATVAGRFEGDITVHGLLLVRSGGVITGTISYGELEVESGAIIDGRLTPVAAPMAAAAPQPQAAPKKVAANVRKPLTNPAMMDDTAAAANTADGELFSKAS